MQKLLSFILCIVFVLSLTACNDADTTNTEPLTATIDELSSNDYPTLPIIGTWICDDISEDCYFIFEENGDAFAKWGTSTIYGYFDYFEEDDVYDIDIPNFLYNEYEGHFGGDVMTLKSEDSRFTFEKATMPEITINAPDNLKVDKKLIGNWQSADSYECYEFKEDSTAVITDMMNYATIDCKYSCDKGVITFYYMSSETKEGSREYDYNINEYGKLVMGDYTYENVTGQ